MSDSTAPSFASLMDLTREAPDVLVGRSLEYPWGRVYGGLVFAQGLRAALHSVDPAFRVHSAHAYFIRGGTSQEPIRYAVDRIRDGRSFATRRVVAQQAAGPILNLSASFQRPEEEAEVSLVGLPGDLPEPEELPRDRWTELLETRMIPTSSERPGHAAAWIRVPGCPVEDPVMQACALAYASDEMPTVAALLAHPARPPGSLTPSNGFYTASLDHALWLHRPARADQWILHEVECRGLGGARGLSLARLIARDGTHVATVTQESLLRVSRDRQSSGAPS